MGAWAIQLCLAVIYSQRMDMAAIEAFVAAADGLSFTAAAEVLGITPSGVSKAVSRLEDELKVRLFNRSTRSISLTVDGVVLYERCRQVLNDLNDAKLAMLQAQTAPTGKLRVSMPAVFGRLRVIPGISAFMQRYPLMEVEASVTDRFVDVVEEGFDVVIRIGEVPDTRMVARRLSSTRFIVCGSPGYLDAHPAPERPQDLRDHACVAFVSPQTRRLMDWIFVEGGQQYAHTPTGRFAVDSGEAVVDAAVCGAGLVYCQDYMVEREVAAGKLRLVLGQFAAPPQPVVVMYPQNRHLSPRVRVFVDFMVEHLGTPDSSAR
jgi:LysR family transcriptional regulator, regulator for bpeEF and oprC